MDKEIRLVAKMVLASPIAVDHVSRLLGLLALHQGCEYDRFLGKLRISGETLPEGISICPDCDEIYVPYKHGRCRGCYSSELDPDSSDYIVRTEADKDSCAGPDCAHPRDFHPEHQFSGDD